LWDTHFQKLDTKERAFTSKAPNMEKSMHGNQIEVSFFGGQ
jgi:2-dehydropantoate 2-reductase